MATTTMHPIVALEEYLTVSGPAKATVIAGKIHVSETTTRKLLAQLISEGKVEKDGQLFKWTAKKSKKAATKTGETSARREEVAARDELVLLELNGLEGDETMSRNDLVALLKKSDRNITGSFVYLSLFRLHAKGLVERVNVGKRAPEWRVTR